VPRLQFPRGGLRALVIASAIALPAGLITQDILVRQLASSVNLVLPASFVHVLGGLNLLLLALAGLAIAIAGALGPASWAAGSRTMHRLARRVTPSTQVPSAVNSAGGR